MKITYPANKTKYTQIEAKVNKFSIAVKFLTSQTNSPDVCPPFVSFNYPLVVLK